MSNELEEVQDSQGGQLATQRTLMERVRLDARSTIVAYKSSWRELLAIYALAPALAIAVLYPLVVLRDAEVLLRLGDSVFLMLLLVPLLFPLARILAARATLTDRSESSRGQMLSFEDLGFGELAEHLQTRNVHDAPLAVIIIEGPVPGRAIVPERNRSGLPFEPMRKFLLHRMRVECGE